jgi:HAD superfamily hydrolase (TIGR01509 family)
MEDKNTVLKDVELVIYDLDGVLIDSSKGILKAFELTLREVGTKIKQEEIRKRIGVGLIEILKEFLPNASHKDVWRIRDRYVYHFQSLGPEYIQLLSGVTETLRSLKEKGFKQAVATNKTNSEATRILRTLDILQYFDFVIGFMDVSNPKPSPDMILRTLEEFHIAKEKTVFIDDTTFGLTAGISAEVYTVGITTGTHDKETIASVNPNFIIESLPEIINLLEKSS